MAIYVALLLFLFVLAIVSTVAVAWYFVMVLFFRDALDWRDADTFWTSVNTAFIGWVGVAALTHIS